VSVIPLTDRTGDADASSPMMLGRFRKHLVPLQPARRLLSSIQVHVVPIMDDNYSYLMIDSSTGVGACVDPGQAQPIIDKVFEIQKKEPFQLKHILATHKHGDHVDGILELKERFPGIAVIGTGYETIPGVTHRVYSNDQFQIGRLHARTLYTPCHTSGHVCFHVSDGNISHGNNESSSVLFSGDTLFLGGCGRFFEGTANQMLENMDQFLELPPWTQIYCGHEYTLSNMKFLHQLSSSDSRLFDLTAQYLHKYQLLRDGNLPTVPSTLQDERRYNAFMKCREGIVQDLVGSSGDPIETMRRLRELKNNY
jgi:hydroxyacylglutathione hydrolase